MSRILVCGLVNVETTVKISQFPIEYCPIDYNFFGIDSNPAGVGLNLSLSFSSLSDEVTLLSMIGNDSAGEVVRNTLKKHNVTLDYLCDCDCTAQSVVMYDESGRRRIFCDLKDFQEKRYDEELFKKAAQDCDTLCLCNINFSRNLLGIAKSMGKTVACDVHTLYDVNDDYNSDFMAHADILFLSNENIKYREEQFINELKNKYNCKIIVVGMGDMGALMYVRGDRALHFQPAVRVREIVNTVGAGDSLFSSFVHFYTKGVDPYLSLKYATIFASYKIGENGAARGFLDEKTLIELSGEF